MDNTDYKTINHDIRNVNGSSIQMPPWFSGEEGWGNLDLPNVYELDTIQKYPHGTAFREGERTWFYAQYKGYVNTTSQATITAAGPLAGNTDKVFGRGMAGYGFIQDYAASNIYGVAGAPTLYIITADAGDVTERANDFYAGGTYFVRNSGNATNMFQGGRVIKQVYSATSLTVDGHAITTPSILTLDQNLVATATWGTALGTVMPNKWKLVVAGQESAYQRWMPILGASCVGNITAANTWLWLQTHGEITIGFASSDLFGDTIDMVGVYWMADGSIDPGTFGTAYIQQLAGYVVSNSISEAGSAATENYPVVYLTMFK